jgi:hypothetical protein
MNWQNYCAVRLLPGFDTFPAIHTTLSFFFCGGLLVWLLFFPHRWRDWFVAATLAVLFFLRLPSIMYNREINPDESQMITQGKTLAVDPVYFRSVDGTTIGPLDSYALIMPSWIGLPFDYRSARLLGFLLIASSLFFLYKTARLWFGERPAQLALLPVLFTLGLTQNGDLLSYCSELVPFFLLSAAIWLFAAIDTRQQTAFGNLFLVGLLLGLIPLGKLQGAPLSAVLGLCVAMSVIQQTASLRQKLTQLGLLMLGALVFPVAFIGIAWANGLYNDFWLFYIEGNLRYGGNTNHWQNVLNFPRHLTKGQEFGWLVVFSGLLLLLALGRYATMAQRPAVLESWAARLAVVGLSVLAAVYTVTRTGTEFSHYFFFMAGPLFLLLALSWTILLLPRPRPAFRVVATLAPVLFLAAIAGKSVLNYAQGVPLDFYPQNRNGLSTPQPPVVQQIRKYANEGESLVVWGWRCDYYVSAEMPQGTAENHSERCVFQSAMTPVYQQRYLRDFYRSFPPVFVDAVGNQNMWLTDRKTQGHEIIKPLGAFVKAHYKYLGMVSDTRIYVRLDRVKGLPKAQNILAIN